MDDLVKEVHVTDLQTFVLCRRKWDFGSTLRQGRGRSFPPEPLILGLGVHEGLDYGYRNSVGTGKPMRFVFDDAKDRFDKWLSGRIAKIIARTGPLIPAEEDNMAKLRQLGLTMLKHYELWSPNVDYPYTLLSTEESFKVPIPGLDAVYAGRFDGRVRHLRSGKIYIFEFKTAKSLGNMSGTFRGIQPTAYMWAAGQLYPPTPSGVLYRCLRKRIPDVPKRLSTPMRFSSAKKQQLSLEWFRFYVQKWAKANEVSAEDVLAANMSVVSMLGSRENQFFMERRIPRTKKQLSEAVIALQHEGRQMVDPDVPIYPLSGYHCSWCAFKEVCDLFNHDMADEAQALLEIEFANRNYWED